MIKSLKRLWSHLSRRRRLELTLVLIMVVLTSFAEVLTIGTVLPFLGALAEPEKIFHHPVVQPMVRVLELSEGSQLLFPLTVAFGLAAIFAGAMRLTLVWAQARYSSVIGTDFGISIFRRTLYQPYSFHLARNSGDVISAISNKTTVVVFQTLFPLLVVVSSFIMLAAITLVLLYLEPMIALSAICGFASIYAIVIVLTKKRMFTYGEQINLEQNKVIRALQEGLGGVRDILIDGTQLTFCEIYRRSDFLLRRAQANMLIIGNGPRFVVEAMGMVLITGLAFNFSGRQQDIAGVMPVLGALALGAQRLMPAMQQVYSGWTAIRGSQATLLDVLDMLDQPLPEHADQPTPQPIAFSRSITMNNLGLRYLDSEPWVLRNVTLELPKGARVGFIGQTGSGKSSLLDVIMGLLQPSEGYLSIDGTPVSYANCRAWQTCVAHVPQSIFLTDASVTENIAFGVSSDRIDIERVRWAAEQAQIAQTIESWSSGYETLVGERGMRLSGGQRQRIGIARALYKQAGVIIFDEATSALDNETERAVMQAIDGLSKDLTVIIVAHRLSTLKNCTMVVELEGGRVKRTGSYAEIVGIQ